MKRSSDGNRKMRYAALALGIMVLLSVRMGHPFQPEENPFRFSVHAEPNRVQAGERFRIHLEITFGREYQLYADETTLTPVISDAFHFDPLEADAPSIKKDPYLGDIAIRHSPVRFVLPVVVDNAAEPGNRMLSITLRYQACTDNSCLMPAEKSFEIPITVTSPSMTDTASPGADRDREDGKSGENPFRRAAGRFGMAGVILLAIGVGFLSSLTPCVYPMIPVTISVVASRSEGHIGRGFVLSLVYVLGMSLTYAVFGVMAALSGGLFGAYAGHPVVRAVVAGVFILMALGMFDVFFVQTPSAITHRIIGRPRSGPWGVFLTGSASGAVVGPCVGPIIVSLLLYIAESGNILSGFLIMWCFAMGMGILFVVIGTFSGAATAIPRAGDWMEKIKQLFGVVLLTIALFHLQPLLPADVFHLLALALAIGAGIFLGSLWPFDTMGYGLKRVIRGGWLILVILLMAMGFRWLIGTGNGPESMATKPGIDWVFDETQALAMARETGRPVMIDFYADWCAACKQLDRKTFTNPEVIREAKRFVALKIDATVSDAPAVRDLLRKYRVVGLPTILFLDSNGAPRWNKTITAYMPAREFVRRMRDMTFPDAD